MRVRLAGSVRLLADAPDGLVTMHGQLVDLSEIGCALRAQKPLGINLVGRVCLDVAGKALWLPVVTRWVGPAAGGGWTVGCEFDRPTREKQQILRALVAERRRLTA